jgi:hypothetical protein
MAPISITVDPRSLERFFYWIIIIGLGVALVFTYIHGNKQGKELETLKGNGNTNVANEQGNLLTGAVTNNSSATGQAQIVETPECTYNSECANGKLCTNGKCTEKPPECIKDIDCINKGTDYTCVNETCTFAPECEDDTDCKSGFECLKSVCEEMDLSGELTFKIENIKYIYEENATTEKVTTRLRSFDIIIENGLDEDVDYTAYVWFVSKSHRVDIGKLTWVYKWGSTGNEKTIDIPVVKSGATYEKTIMFTHGDGKPGGNAPLSSIDDGDQAYVAVWLYKDSLADDDGFDTEDEDPLYMFEDDFTVES